ncbi:MAG: putative S-layer protein [Nanoarchaeota archaeon]
MKAITLSLFFVLGIALLGFASAASVFPENTVGNTVTLDHDKSFEIKFNLKNDDSEHNVTDLKISLPPSNIGQWTSAKLGAAPFQIVNNQITLNEVTIANKTSSQLITLVFKVDKYVAPGAYNNQVSFSGKLAPSGVAAVIDPLSVSVTVKSNPALAISKLRDLKVNQTGIVNVTNTGNILLNSISLAASGSLNVTFSPSESFSLGPSESKSIQVQIDSSASNLLFGDNSVSLTAKSGELQSSSLSLNLRNSFCSNGQVGTNLTIRNVDFVEYGEDDTDWKLLDHIKLDVEVENTGSNDVNDVIVELGLFNSRGENVISDIDFISKDDEKIDLGRIRDGDQETVTFEYTVPADLDTGSYKLAVKTYSDNVGQTNLCSDESGDLSNNFYQNINVDRESDEGKFISFDNIRIVPSEATCEDPVTLNTVVYNIGDEDQDRVLVNLYNKALGIDQNYEIRGGLDQGDNGKVIFNFAIPKNALDKTYDLELSSEYDYKNGVYRIQSDESFKVPLKVVGCKLQPTTPISTRIASISAALESDAAAGKEMIVKATVRNIGNVSANFILGAKNFESWAKLNDISERILTLNAGESKDVTFNFLINNNVEGDNSFVIEVISGDKSETREVTASVTKQSASLSGFFKGNTLAWAIGLINVLLIVIIIIVAVRIARR